MFQQQLYVEWVHHLSGLLTVTPYTPNVKSACFYVQLICQLLNYMIAA